MYPPPPHQFISNRAAAATDYELIYLPDPGQPDLAFNSAYRLRLYNNTLVALRPPDSSRMTATALAAYREIYRQAIAGEPVIRADYDVYHHGQNLLFVKENCPQPAPEAEFSARLFPHHRETLPPPWGKYATYARFSNRRVQLGPLCLAVLQLPPSAQGDLFLRQRPVGPAERADVPLYEERRNVPYPHGYAAAGAPGWEEIYSLSRPGLRDLLAARRQRRQKPAEPEDFEVFLDLESGRHRLLYAKNNCAPAEYAARVTLHIYPANPAAVPAARQNNGYENWDFALQQYGIRTPGRECIAIVPLPDYPISSILTGQAGAWSQNLYPPKDPDTLRAAYAALTGAQPAARANFALYLHDNRLTYLRETCAATDTAANFFLHITPRDTAASPAERPPGGDANLDFAFARYGGHFDGKCLAAVPLPEYPIAALRTGQDDSWEVNIYPPADPDYLRAAAAALAGAQPAVRADFDLYIRDNRLTYRRESCAAADTAGGFFLHIIPEDVADLPAERRDAGFANLDFAFARYGGHFDGQCLATVPLPEYPIAAIRTGQRNPGQGDLWSVELIAAPGRDRLRAAHAALSEIQPAARSNFDLYLRDNQLTYRRESCAAADTAANFFLHIIPQDVADLPAERQDAGFANLDFAFNRYGGLFDGKCLATIPLPDYPIAAIRTGQYVAGQGEVWSAELTLTP